MSALVEQHAASNNNSKSPSAPITGRRQSSELYRFEKNRLETFERWPCSWIDKTMLAMLGFWYTGWNDNAKCYFCKVEICSWEREDTPLSEHMLWSPNCPLLRHHNTNNVPIDKDALERILPPISYDYCGTMHNEDPKSGETNTIENCIKHVHPEYATLHERMSSFCNWSYTEENPTTQQLAEAGFFYAGFKDCVKCFACDVSLKDWKCTDDPWVEHARWSMHRCPYLELMKGKQFIIDIKEKRQTLEMRTKDNTNMQSTEASTFASQGNIEQKCKICFENMSNTVFLPCGHIVACNVCAASLTKCPFCRGNLTDIKRVYYV